MHKSCTNWHDDGDIFAHCIALQKSTSVANSSADLFEAFFDFHFHFLVLDKRVRTAKVVR
jgi:hypothetical protein